MRNIFKIAGGDLKRISTNVVAIVMILGLCVVPILYAWFNIFSNWDPYGPDSTSRISVAVASEDEGAELLGLKLNVGNQVISALESNDSIGWVFVDSADEAFDKVYSSDCYAALIVPKDFTKNVLSFLSGDIKNPEIDYYQNDKKNAIAPKITGKAKTAVQEQVNATFVQTIAGDIGSVISVANANGINAESLLNKFSGDIVTLSDKLTDACTALNAANGLTNAARNLIKVSINLTGDASNSLAESQKVLGKTENKTATIDSRIDGTVSDVSAALGQIDANLSTMSSNLTNIFTSVERYNEFVQTGLAADIARLDSMSANCATMADAFSSIGFNAAASQMNSLKAKLDAISEKLGAFKESDEANWESVKTNQEGVLTDIADARSLVQSLKTSIKDELAPRLHSALNSAENASGNVRGVLSSLENSTSALSGTLGNYLGSLGSLQSDFAATKRAIENAQSQLKALSDLVKNLADSELLKQIGEASDSEVSQIADYLASPINMDTEVIYEIPNYGSAASPFYIVLAQWVGALFCAVFLKVKIRPEDMPAGAKLHERFFGRYSLFFLVAMAQALIVSLGSLYYVRIDCLSPGLFVLASVVTGITFSILNYALIFALDNIGMAASVIMLVAQVAGSGGTYPVEVLPDIFQKLYKFMPFKYSMNALRETIGGFYKNDYWYNLEILGGVVLGSIILGLALYYPFLWLNRLIEQSKRKSEIMQ